MSKKFVLDCCEECPSRIDVDSDEFLNLADIGFQGYHIKCIEAERFITKDDNERDFPDWCPLEDAENP